MSTNENSETIELAAPSGYYQLDLQKAKEYVAQLPSVQQHLGGGAANEWQVDEIGDGNLNFVYKIVGRNGGSVIVKQAVPYVRCIGPSWKLAVNRAFFESAALREEYQHTPERVPFVFHYDDTMSTIVMECISPHIILRKGMIAGIYYPNLATHMAEFMALNLFKTSDLYLPAAEKRKKVASYSMNIDLTSLTEQVFFTDPYMDAKTNRWTSPQLDATVQAIRSDSILKAAVHRLKGKFLTSTQALLHGDLHSGSIMVTETDTKVIDPEFAFFGPMGFDVGSLLANLFLTYFAKDGHQHDGIAQYKQWILEQIRIIWTRFSERFLELWQQEHKGDLYNAPLFQGSTTDKIALQTAKNIYMRKLFRDTLGFAGTEMIRRTIGVAHNADLECIADKDLRAACEKRGITLGRELIINCKKYDNIDQVIALASQLAHEGKTL